MTERLDMLRAEGNERLAALIQELSAELAATRARAERAEAALSNLIHDAAGGQVIVPADSLKDARPLQWYTDPDGEVEIVVVYERSATTFAGAAPARLRAAEQRCDSRGAAGDDVPQLTIGGRGWRGTRYDYTRGAWGDDGRPNR